jgi:hypothetical protein
MLVTSIEQPGRQRNTSPTATRVLFAQEDRNTYIHVREARVIAPGVSPLPVAGMHWRGRMSEVSGWSIGHLGAEPPAAAGQSNA